ncbi:MAG TPA: peptidylprolyl isomerase [Thermoanaerobaculia bacterium]|nr:peptidylprolyl isomerase [Thermoanaerobaculia bacterium]
MRPGRAAALALLLAAPACTRASRPGAPGPSVVATVGDRHVTLDEFFKTARNAAGDDPRNVSPRVLSSLLDQYLDEVLLERAVASARPAVAGATPAERRRAYLARRAGLETLSDADLRKEYDAHPERYRRPALVRVAQLLFPAREAADAALRKLREGTPWIEVSRASSAAPNAASGGELGLLAQTDLPREFEKAIWALPAGGTSGVLAAPHGFHVFRVEERLDARDIPFEEARPGLRISLAEERSAKAVEDTIAEARSAFPVAVLEDHLPFPYVGTNPKATPP